MTRSIAAILLVAAATSLSGCALVPFLSFAKKSRPEIAAPAGPDLQPASADTGPRLAIIAAHKKVCEARSYRMKSVDKSTPPRARETEMEFTAPDRLRTIVTIGGSKVETIRVGNRFYKRSKGEWTEIVDRFGKNLPDILMDCELTSGRPGIPGYVETELKLIGADEVSGKKVTVYQSTTEYQSNSGPDKFVVTTSVGVDDGRLYRLTISTSADPTRNEVTETTYSDYDSAMTIEAPI